MTTSTVPSHTSVEDRQAIGERAREQTPLSSQADWDVSPFTFYRGAAKVMATDLATTPMAGLVVQLCGDAHLSNFGGFASPERQLLFGLNDFDETLPGPFEYDLKRMAASFTIADRNNGFTKADTKAATLRSVTAYREAMAGFAAMGTMAIWYAHLAEDELMQGIRDA